ncbi:MAG: signal recognition particle-docking protein FtsY [Actinomycetota bacterium]|nr:signal recognition particle-docking protein FtsY [Actinomycetota bacterium]
MTNERREPERQKVMPRLSKELSKTRNKFSLFAKLQRAKTLDSEFWTAIEEILISADVGVKTTQLLIAELKQESQAQRLNSVDEVTECLKEKLKYMLASLEREVVVEGSPAVWLFVGVNGVGKTTSIGKLAYRQNQLGIKSVLAAGDTFRAAAPEQLEMWAQRCDSELIKGAEGADPSSVIFDAIEHANSRGTPLLLADTAGRLHTKTNLMDELSKIQRVATKGTGKVTEILLVLDATTGQNGLEQAKSFASSVDVTGIILTKLDGTSRGGIVFAIHQETGIPVKFVGIGENPEDLIAFDPEDFVEAIFDFQHE